jgi:hypothetical protein
MYGSWSVFLHVALYQYGTNAHILYPKEALLHSATTEVEIL